MVFCGTLLRSTASDCNTQRVGMVTAGSMGRSPILALPAGAPPCAPNITGLLWKERGMQEQREEVKGGGMGRKKVKLSEEHPALAATSKAPLPQDIKQL